MKPIEFPVMNVRMLPLDKLEANDYNPNRMAAPELKLLKISIEEDGFTQPIVAYYNAERDVYEIVDGFHRYLCARDYFHLDKVPVTVIDKPSRSALPAPSATIAPAARTRLWTCRTSFARSPRAAGR